MFHLFCSRFLLFENKSKTNICSFCSARQTKYLFCSRFSFGLFKVFIYLLFCYFPGAKWNLFQKFVLLFVISKNKYFEQNRICYSCSNNKTKNKFATFFGIISLLFVICSHFPEQIINNNGISSQILLFVILLEQICYLFC